MEISTVYNDFVDFIAEQVLPFSLIWIHISGLASDYDANKIYHTVNCLQSFLSSCHICLSLFRRTTLGSTTDNCCTIVVFHLKRVMLQNKGENTLRVRLMWWAYTIIKEHESWTPALGQLRTQIGFDTRYLKCECSNFY